MKNRWNWLLLLIILAAFALRVYRLDLQDIWWDEARNIDVAGRALTQIATARELDIHPPVYFYLLHGWLTAAGPSRRSTARPGRVRRALHVALVRRAARAVDGRARTPRRRAVDRSRRGLGRGVFALSAGRGAGNAHVYGGAGLVGVRRFGGVEGGGEGSGIRGQESGVRRQWTMVDFQEFVLAAFRPVFRPGAVDTLCCGLRPCGAVGLGIGVGAARCRTGCQPVLQTVRGGRGCALCFWQAC